MLAILHIKGLPSKGRPIFISPLIVLLVCLLLLTLPMKASGQVYDYNERCRKVHQALLNRNLSKADRLLAEIRSDSPNNLIPYYLAHYRDFLKLYMYGDEALYNRLDDKVSKRLNELEKGPENSPYYHFTRAEVRIIWSLLQLRKGDYFSAGMDLYSGYKQYKAAAEAFPDFWPARRVLLAIKGVVGTLPDTYQWVIERFGIKGDLQQALDRYPSVIDNLNENPHWGAFHQESYLIFSYMQFHLLDAPEKAWKTMKEATQDHANNSLSCLLRANMALNLKKGQTALQLLESYKQRGAPIPYLNYLLGCAMLYDLQPESRYYFKKYVDQFQGESYIKDTYLKMGWAGLLEGDTAFYNHCREKLKTAGSTVRATDEQAMKEADHYDKPNRYLLKARLRYDGGYFEQAKSVLKGKRKPTIGKNPRLEELEYYYRLGRVQKALNKQTAALKAFDQLRPINPNKRKHYYLPASHLQAGLIYEDLGSQQQAKKAFQQVLNFSGYPYEKALSQKAKAGLKRIRGND